MTLTVFGASGRTGNEVVRQALDRGHDVVAFVRATSTFTTTDDRLSVVRGDVGDAAAVERAVRGADAVVSVLGPRRRTPDRAVTRGTRTIVRAMEHAGVERLVITSGAGVRDPLDRPTLVDRLIRTLLEVFARDVLEDMRGATEVVRASDRAWTVVRVPRLTDGPAQGSLRAGYLGANVGVQLARSDLAAFVLDQLGSEAWVRAAPVVSA